MSARKDKGSVKRGTLLDLTLIFFVLLSLALTLFRLQAQKDLGGARRAYSVTLRVEVAQPQIADCLLVGDVIFDAYGEPLGEIMSMGVSEAPVVISNGSETLRGVPKDFELINIELELHCYGTQRAEMLLLNGKTPMPIGERVPLYTQRTALTYLILRVEEQSDNPS